MSERQIDRQKQRDRENSVEESRRVKEKEIFKKKTEKYLMRKINIEVQMQKRVR